MKQIEFCGSFNGFVSPRKGETTEEALERIESSIQRALDARKTLDVNIAVDFGEFTVHEED